MVSRSHLTHAKTEARRPKLQATTSPRPTGLKGKAPTLLLPPCPSEGAPVPASSPHLSCRKGQPHRLTQQLTAHCALGDRPPPPTSPNPPGTKLSCGANSQESCGGERGSQSGRGCPDRKCGSCRVATVLGLQGHNLCCRLPSQNDRGGRPQSC